MISRPIYYDFIKTLKKSNTFNLFLRIELLNKCTIKFSIVERVWSNCHYKNAMCGTYYIAKTTEFIPIVYLIWQKSL